MPSFAYNTGIPAAADNPSNDQPDMLQNTNSINSIIAVDHYSFGSSANFDGFHKQITLPVLGSIPTIASGQGSVYTKTATTASAHTESTLFYSPDTTGNEYQLSRTISTSFSTFSTNGAYGTPPGGFTQIGGWTYLPGGMLFQYGFFGKAAALGNSGTIQYPVAFTTSAFSINVTLIRAATNSHPISMPATSSSTTSFQFQTDSTGSDGVYWQAIGV